MLRMSGARGSGRRAKVSAGGSMALLAVGVVWMGAGCFPADSDAADRRPPPPPAQSFSTEFAAPDGRALELEDYYRLPSVGGTQLSPDGDWVAYSVTYRLEETNGNRREAWVVPADGSAEPRQIRHDGQDVASPRWTDSGRLQYTAGGNWSIDPSDPDAAPFRIPPSNPTGNVSPDGRWVVSVEDAPADSESSERVDDPPLSPFEARHEDRFEGVQFDWLSFQRDGARFPAPDPTAGPAREIMLRPTGDGGDPRQLTDLGLRPGGVIWHPGSGSLAFTADPDWRNERLYARTDLFLVDVDGQVNRLTDDGWTHGSLRFSPDGEWLAYTAGLGTDLIIAGELDHGGSRDLFIRPADGGDPINLTGDWDYDAGTPRWSPDSRYIYFTAEKEGGSHLFRVAPDMGPVEQLTSGERSHNGIQFDRDFTTIAYTVGLYETGPEVHVADIDGSNERKLTDVFAAVHEEIELSRAERLLFASADGTHIEGWLTYPYGYDPANGPYPMIVNSHGGPHAASGYGFSFKHQYFAANGYFVLETNFRSSTGYGDDFKWATWGAWGDKDGEDVMAGIDYAIANFAIDPDRVASIGHSYGGFMTNWLITQYPDRFAAAAPGAGIVNWVSDYGTADIARTKETEFFGTPWEEDARDRMIRQSPLTYADRVTAPTLFIHGELDQRVPYSEAEQMYVALKKNGIPTKVIQYEGMSHGISGHWNSVHRMMNELRWFELWMGRDSAEGGG